MKKTRKPGKPPATGDTAATTVSLSSIEQLKAIADPLRQRLLEQFHQQPATTKQVAERLGLKPTRLYHHVAKLERAGLIRLVETRPVRGTTEKYYSAVAGKLQIDRSAFPGPAARAATDMAGLQIIDSLFTNVREEVADYIEDNERKSGACAEEEQEVMFGQAEVCVDAATALQLREKMFALLSECQQRQTGPADADNAEQRKYRVLVGWYPRVDKN